MDESLRAQLQAHLAAAGLEVDGDNLEALLPGYSGLRNGVRRLAALDLGEREPALIPAPSLAGPSALEAGE